MICQPIKVPGGGGVICRGRPARRRCSTCGRLPAEFECDWPVQERQSGTCDAAICVRCRDQDGEKDYCWRHRHPQAAAGGAVEQRPARIRKAMRAITLRDPWAQLVLIGAKRIETRGFQVNPDPDTPGGRVTLVLHSSKTFTEEEDALCKAEPFRKCLVDGGAWPPGLLPRGQVLALFDVTGCTASEDLVDISAQERAFGNYADGRWGWHIENVRRCQRPVPARGMQGLWPVDLTLEERIRAELRG